MKNFEKIIYALGVIACFIVFILIWTGL